MRLFTKIFISVITVFGIAFLAAGYFILSYSFESKISRELEFALQQYKYDKFTVQGRVFSGGDSDFEEMGKEISVPACFLFEGQPEVCTGEREDFRGIVLGGLPEDSYWYKVVHTEAESFILIGSRMELKGWNIGLVTKADITETVRQQEMLGKYFERFFYTAMGAGVLLITGLSLFLTNPIKKMTRAADRIAGGLYSERLSIRSRDELGELANSFNRMADAVEENIEELKRNAREKEDFVSNFAHELKTPLTSVIGYADRLYRRELTREEVRKAAWYIWNEGMHLEALSLKLMELTNLNRQDFPLTVMPIGEFLMEDIDGDIAGDITGDAAGAAAPAGVKIRFQAEKAYVRADYDLLKSLMRNLTDNAVKAECKNIWIKGKQCGKEYCIRVSDDGKGIPEEEIPWITEAFYMVDKARSRKRHSAGIGLALVQRIVQIHGGSLTVESREGKGTVVEVRFPIADEGGADDEDRADDAV